MSDLYLKAADEATMMAALSAAGLVEEGAVLQVVQHGPGESTSCYVVGTMYDTTDPENPVALPGFHVNVRSTNAAVLAALTPLAIEVATPAYVFA